MERFRRVWVFSDLHLTRTEEPLYRSLLTALDEPVGATDAVIFAGDVFDLVVGDSEHYRSKHRLFLDAVARLLARKVRVFYIEGNHDFHLSGFMPRGVRFEPEAVCVEVGGEGALRKLYVAHGDLVDRSDVGYLRLRAFFRSAPLQHLARALPGAWIDRIASKLSRPPERKASELPEHWVPLRRDALRKVFRDFAGMIRARGFDGVILGHCHDFASEGGFYFNMGYPPVHRQFLVCGDFPDSGGEMIFRRNFPGF
jgi:UDP-2,3-diacylglucosamine hydrolase